MTETAGHWNLLVVNTSSSDSDVVADWLWQIGAVAVEEITLDDGTVDLRTSVGDNPSKVFELMRSLAVERGVRVSVRIDEVDRSVADTWRRYAEPVEVDGTWRIVPEWIGATREHDVLIEPGDVFGLGNHPTTVGTLRCALRHAQDGNHVVDAGCGTGVLGIALAKARSVTVSAFDIAPSTIEVVRRNCVLNEVSAVTVIRSCDDVETGSADVVLANILAPVLIEIAADLSRTCAHDGVIVLSGMRSEQWERVSRAYPGFQEIDREEIDGWLTVVLSRLR